VSGVLNIEGLSVAYGPVSALEDVTLSVGAGEAVALVGANGAGKSTLFKSIVGFLRPRSGRLFFRGRDMSGVGPERRVHMGLGYAPEGRRVFPGLTVRENLEVAMFAGKAERERRLDRAFTLFPQLAERRDQLGWQLSGGQQQMLAIGREVLAAIKTIITHGTAVLLAEQNVRKALACCGRAYVLETGKVVLSGATSTLRNTEEIRKAFLGA
jgi:branched-chain amino acid transport system ATP-binding protein